MPKARGRAMKYIPRTFLVRSCNGCVKFSGFRKAKTSVNKRQL